MDKLHNGVDDTKMISVWLFRIVKSKQTLNETDISLAGIAI